MWAVPLHGGESSLPASAKAHTRALFHAKAVVDACLELYDNLLPHAR